MNGDLILDFADQTAYRGFLADPQGMPLVAEDNCTLIGPPRPCDIRDVVVLARALQAPPLPPGISPVCASSLAGCEVLNAAECLLPYPSTHYTTPSPTPTGLRLAITQAGLPEVNGEPLTTSFLNELDGFSPMAQIMMHFPQGVDLVQSDASRLLPATPGGPPWVDARTYDGRSLDPTSPSVLLDAGTGQRVLHWLELDARADGNPARQALVLRPALSLIPGHRYIVAMRNLKTGAAAEVVAEAPFAALRDSVITSDPAIEGRRAYFDASIFPALTANGVERADLVLAFDFIVQSEHQLTHQMLAMRDQAFTYTASLSADPNAMGFSVGSMLENDCNAPGQVVWREITGTFQSPLFLTAVPQFNTPQHSIDPNDVPVQNGFMSAPFNISIPCSVLNPSGPVSRPIVLGHGLFGTGASMMAVPPAAGQVTEWTYIAGATDWRGLSNQDQLFVALGIIGLNESQLNNYPAFPDRLRQGMANTLVLAKLMKLGIFNRDPAFQTPGGQGVFPGPSEEMYYYGISLGGIMGGFFAALTPDVERFGLDVPAMNFACLLQRSTQFGIGNPSLEDLIESIGLVDPMKAMLGLHLLNELWVSAEPGGYARHVTSDPLPGSGAAARVLMTPAWLDKQVSNQCTEAAARTLGLSSHEGSLQQGLQGIPDSVGPLDSALVMYDTGAFDLFDPLHAPFIPPLANEIPSPVCDPHGDRPPIPAGVLQLVTFLQPGGQIQNFCDGICDAATPIEQPPEGICNPLAP